MSASQLFFRASAADFKKIPSSPVAYWLPATALDVLDKTVPLADISKPRKGMCTRDNDYFVRLWAEISFNDIGFNFSCRDEAMISQRKWFPYQKGGEFRQWYGNHISLVDWEKDGYRLLNMEHLGWKGNSTNHNLTYIFKPAIVWSKITSAKPNFRYSPLGFLYDDASGLCSINDPLKVKVILGFLCSKVGQFYMGVINPTLNIQPGNMASMPFLEPTDASDVRSIIKISQEDWDQHETSWGFTSLPLLQSCFRQPTLKGTYQKLRQHWFNMTMKMQQLEEENNRIFIEAYGLQDELTQDVPLKEITLTCNPFYRYGKTAVKSKECEVGEGTVESDECEVRSKNSPLATSHFPLNRELEERLLADTMKEFISYAVGCMFGRYSLDKEGLILANQGETLADYYKKVGKDECEVRSDEQVRSENSPLSTSHFPLSAAHSPLGEAHPPLSFTPDDDNVIPILDGEWFTDDVTERFRRFLKVTFGKEYYQENLAFIEQSIGKDIRKYFLKDFYADHVKRYKKRPIYWMFSSPKGSFNALIYMHRYQPTTASVVLNGYLREFRTKLIARKEHLEQVSISASVSQRDKTQALKEIEKLKKMIDELESWERDVLYPLAAEQIDIDLDDGVKVNYPKFGKALKKVVGLS